MTVRLTIELPHPPERVRAYLRDPATRTQWQSSLRRVDDVAGRGEVGSTWTDVTWPGLRPAMRVTEDSPDRWAEAGEWRGATAGLALDFAAAPAGTRLGVEADVVPPPGLGWLRRPLEAAAARAIAADLRRAGRRM